MAGIGCVGSSIITPYQSCSQITEVLIVFVDHTECLLLKFLRRGFRHCFFVLRINDRWLAFDPLKGSLEINYLDLPSNFNLAKFYHDQGHVVMCGKHAKNINKKNAFVEFLTCVNITKRFLSLRSFWIWTPWQLYRFLNKDHDASQGWSRFRNPDAVRSKNRIDNINK